MPLTSAEPVRVLHPGDVVCAGRGTRIATLLGSCVAIILTDPRRTLGAMCHIVYSGATAIGRQDSGAFAEVALASMVTLLRARGIVLSMCEAYVYGGANMFPGVYGSLHVGEQNARWALATLADAGVPVIAQDVGGQRYRRLAWVVGPDRPQVVAVPGPPPETAR